MKFSPIKIIINIEIVFIFNNVILVNLLRRFSSNRPCIAYRCTWKQTQLQEYPACTTQLYLLRELYTYVRSSIHMYMASVYLLFETINFRSEKLKIFITKLRFIVFRVLARRRSGLLRRGGGNIVLVRGFGFHCPLLRYRFLLLGKLWVKYI